MVLRQRNGNCKEPNSDAHYCENAASSEAPKRACQPKPKVIASLMIATLLSLTTSFLYLSVRTRNVVGAEKPRAAIWLMLMVEVLCTCGLRVPLSAV